MANCRRALGFVAVSIACIAGDGRAAPACVTSLGGLRELLADPGFAVRWRETTMDDGRPLVLTILERKGALVLEFAKAGEGLWAEVDFVVCLKGAVLEARAAAHQVRLGPAASWLTRFALADGGVFTLTRPGVERLRIETGTWSGTFSRDP